MPLLALIVSDDEDDIRLLREVLEELSVEMEITATAEIAASVLAVKPINAILLDGELPGIWELIEDQSKLQESEQPRIIAVLSSKDNSQRAFEIGAHFVLYKPISRDRSLVSLQYAFRSSGRDRRQGDRRPVFLSTTVTSPVIDTVPVTLSNLSPTGTSIRAKRPLPPDSKLYFEFQIPGQMATVRLSGNVVWQDFQGRAGIRFASVPASSRKALDQWLETTDREEAAGAPEVAMDIERFGSMERTPLERKAKGTPPPLIVRQNLPVPERKDRRAQSRYRISAGVRVSDQCSSIPNWCNIADISEGGCYIELVMPFPKGTLLNLEVRTGDNRLMTRGKVQSCHPGKGMGVQFSIENEEHRGQLRQIVEFLAAGAATRKD
jgi:CheY-like chemotaxis protein